MEVTKATFCEQLPQIKEAIDKATFLSIDCELTGLSTSTDINGYDTPEQYYEKVRRGSKDFLVIQYGLCAFRYDAEANAFKQQAYTFYVFPKTANKFVPDQRFLCQTSSIEFLISHGFDFNKLFKEGIPYLNSVQELNYRDCLREAQKIRVKNIMTPQNSVSRIIPVPEQDKAFVDSINKQIQDFIDSTDEQFTLPKCNAFLRLLIYQTVRTNFEDKVGLKVQALDGRDKFLTVIKFQSPEQRLQEDKRRTEEEENELENTIGFSKVVRYIVESGKLVIGHNMCLDLLHTIDKFLTPLPEDYREFKDCAYCLFSNILDTKYMSSTDDFKDLISSNVLGHLLETVSKEPFKIPVIEVEEGACGYAVSDGKEHEAGYDAYITGLCFLAMWNRLGYQKCLPDGSIFGDFDLVKPYMNRLFLMRLQDNPYIHLGGRDPTPQRDHVFYVTFPKDWKLNDIMHLFSPFGPVYVSWINDHSAYVGLSKREQAAVALNTLSQSDTYGVMTYARRQAHLAGLSTIPGSPLPISRKRVSDCHNSSLKKRRTVNIGEPIICRRSIEPIPECQETEIDRASTRADEPKSNVVEPKSKVETVPVVMPGKKRVLSKTFEEDSSWDS